MHQNVGEIRIEIAIAIKLLLGVVPLTGWTIAAG
jgi:hypothetical protein